MSQILIDVTDEEHERLKSLAALNGITLAEYMLRSALEGPSENEDTALEELEAFLLARVRRFETDGAGTRSVDDIFDVVCAEKGLLPGNG